MSKEAQKRIVAAASTALAAWAASRLASTFLDEPEALLQGVFSVAATILASWAIRHVLSKRWGA